jgi:hypothetical protein
MARVIKNTWRKGNKISAHFVWLGWRVDAIPSKKTVNPVQGRHYGAKFTLVQEWVVSPYKKLFLKTDRY